MSDYQVLKNGGAMFGGNAPFVEEMYDRYLQDPTSVDDKWRQYFERLHPPADEMSHQAIIDSIAARAGRPVAMATPGVNGAKQAAVGRLINQYRFLGARNANINPLQYETPELEELTLEANGLDESDLQTTFYTDIYGLGEAPLSDIVAKLKSVYCGTVVAEWMHISNREQREWLRKRMELPRPAYSVEQKLSLLERLMAAELLERYLHTRYAGQKRFSLEGGDTLIPLLDLLLSRGIDDGIKETVIGMAHRGRLNVLINILGKKPADLFLEFEGKHKVSGSGDVKYHMGFSSTWREHDKEMHLALAFNPSHLEISNPVVEGSVRARQDRRGDLARKTVLPILIHGDAAFAGQGVVMETLNLSQIRGYKTGGTINIIINNQIGFTTSSPDDARSTFFCSDVSKMVEVPIMHVHCDDVEGAAYAMETALEYRQKFGVDVVIDLVCFRRHGHNEQDEPFMTQPMMYQKIAQHPGSPTIYAQKLQEEGALSKAEYDKMSASYRKTLEAGESANPKATPSQASAFVDWKKFESDNHKWDWTPKKPLANTKQLAALSEKISTLPANFTPHAQLKKLVALRSEMAKGKRPLDWGMGENLAYAALLQNGCDVRLSGQDCGRGTFAHRHAVWHDQQRHKRDGGAFVPLRNLSDKQGDFLVIDSTLSEEAVLGFEYGYSTTEPNRLVIWEAQFGDFANGAQVVIDQFLSSGQAKWGRMCNLVMLLPHGYEGQGPEHSSARIERYLQLCAEYNMQVCVPSSPAQIYHLLLRQMLRPLRMPLIVITPKSLLRLPAATSSLEDLGKGGFETLLPEADSTIKADKVKRVIFCAGKIYYELVAARQERKIKDIAILRLEQLYPFPHEQFEREIAKYKNAEYAVWCQEEPGNQGAWHRIQHYLRRHLRPNQKLTYSLRPSASSTAAGYGALHKKQQQDVIDTALNLKSIVQTS
ncbi:MAG: 2-oxoglutarate dehydrogenase E1 component [Gammaproteobacteria bacterium WSBS_2016_MAG_OTU1]